MLDNFFDVGMSGLGLIMQVRMELRNAGVNLKLYVYEKQCFFCRYLDGMR